MIYRKRDGFTLIEILVSLSIIVVVASLLAGSAFKALGKIPEIETRVEISQLNAAVATFMSTYNLEDPPPSFLYLREDGLYTPATNSFDSLTVQWLAKVFGKTFNPYKPRDWNGNALIDSPYFLHGQQCLVFWTGGIPSYSASGEILMTGFNASNTDPDIKSTLASKGSMSRYGPFFNFQSPRLTTKLAFQGMFPVYLDAWQVKGNPQPYAYFSTQGLFAGYNLGGSMGSGGYHLPGVSDCNTINAYPYQQGMTANGVPLFLNPNKWQILSAGKDGIFGSDTIPLYPSSVYWNPIGGGFNLTTVNNPSGRPAGWDDQANFTSGVLGVGQY